MFVNYTLPSLSEILSLSDWSISSFIELAENFEFENTLYLENRFIVIVQLFISIFYILEQT